jgi:hypothetical protein
MSDYQYPFPVTAESLRITTVLCEHKSEDESPLIFSWEQTQLFRKQAIF